MKHLISDCLIDVTFKQWLSTSPQRRFNEFQREEIVQETFFNLNRMKLDIDSKPEVKYMLQMKI